MKRSGLIALVCAALFAGEVAGQAADPARVQMTRAELESVLAQLESASGSSAYSGAARARAREEATLVRIRLEEGDFQTGDRVVLDVRNEPTLTDTFTVVAGPSLPLPLGDNVDLGGVLRSELESHLTEHLSKYIRDPELRAESLMRVTVAGEVTSPGFYVVRAQALVGDILMVAGGLTGDADVTKVYIERQGRKIWEGPSLEQAIAQGRTLDQLSIRAGDQVMVPEEATQGLGRTLLYVVPPVVSLLLALTQLR